MKKHGFTLIELLVVIAIIALLLSIIVPSLRLAKEVATGAACLSNQKALATAWHLYQGDNDGFLVGGSTYHSGQRGTPYRWVERPLFNDTDNPEINIYPGDAQITHEYRLNGIRAGRLYPYVGTEKIYNCPGDRTSVKATEPQWAVYRSYSITGLMNSEDFLGRQGGNMYGTINAFRTVNYPGGGTRQLKVATRFSDVRSPGNKHVFVEEDIFMKQRFQLGGFVLMDGNNFERWWDWPAYYHKDSGTIGFADGHAESRRWQDPRTLELLKEQDRDRQQALQGQPQPGNADLEWMNRGYMPMQ